MNLRLYLLIGFCVGIFCVGCSDSSKKKSDAVNLEEFLPKSEREYNYKEDTVIPTKKHIPDSLELLIKNHVKDAEFIQQDKAKKHFPDRLDFKKRFQQMFSVDSVLHEITVWKFEDSLHTVNAFYNWLDCFGSKCKSIRVGETKRIYDGAFQIFVDDLNLIYIASEDAINIETWNTLFQPENKLKWNFRLYQANSQKVRWVGLEKEE